MKIKQYAFLAHEHLRMQGVSTLTRSQVHELLAAASGFSTHAAFHHQAAWCDVPWRDTDLIPDGEGIVRRALNFGLSPGEAERAVQGLVSFLGSSGYAPVRFEELIAALTADEDAWPGTDEAGSDVVSEWVSAKVVSRMHLGLDALFGELPLLLEGLEAATTRGISAAHLATSYMLEPYGGLPEEDDHRFGRELRGRGQWSTEPVGFADIDADTASSFVKVAAKHRYHLLAAARSGDRRAMLLTAKRYGDPGALELEPSNEMDPYDMADLADTHGRPELAHQWLTVLAREGDVSAMRELIEDRSETPFRAWVWMHLSRMLGMDLSRDRHEAINEDGTPYDDDVGGPAYVGGVDGIRLPPLGAEDCSRAEGEAAQLFAVIEENYELD